MFRRLLYRNFRQIYTISNWTRHRLTATGGLLFGGMIASGVFGVDTRQSLSFQIFAFLAAMLIIALLSLAWFRGRFRIHRYLPEYATVKQPLKYKLLIENLGNRSQIDLLLIDELQSAMPGFQEFSSLNDPKDKNRNWFDRLVGYPRLISLIQKKRGASIPPVNIEALNGKDQNEVIMELYPYRRGYIRFTRTRIARPDPLGLVRAIKSCSNEGTLLVLPKTYEMPSVQLQGKRKYQQGGMTLASAVGDSQEFMSLRDYKPGDPLRAIHWRSYAKTGRPIVKEFQDEFFVRQGLLLDTFIEGNTNDVFEEAVSLAASCIVTRQAQDSLLDLMFVGAESYRFTSGRGLSQIENMLEILACVEPCIEPAFMKLDDLIMQHAGETSGIICILLDWDVKRQKLIQKLTGMNIPVMVYLVTDRQDHPDFDTTPLGNYAGNFHVLRTGDIQSQLNQLKHR